MAGPTQNYVPPTGNINIFSSAANDNTIESAVLFTLNDGTTSFASFDAMRVKANVNLIDGTHGTLGSTPTQTEHMRGYPKPTIKMNYEIDSNVLGANGEYQNLVCQPRLNYKIGYGLYLYVDVTEIAQTGIIETHQEWFHFGTSSTAPISSSITINGDSKYLLNTKYEQPTYEDDVNVDCYITADAPFNPSNEIGNTSPNQRTLNYLTYTPNVVAYQTFLKTYTKTSCGGSIGGAVASYSTSLSLSVNQKIYTSAALTTEIAAASYAKLTGVYDYNVINYSGGITSIIPCTKPATATNPIDASFYEKATCGGVLGPNDVYYAVGQTVTIGDKLYQQSGGTVEMLDGFYALNVLYSPGAGGYHYDAMTYSGGITVINTGCFTAA